MQNRLRNVFFVFFIFCSCELYCQEVAFEDIASKISIKSLLCENCELKEDYTGGRSIYFLCSSNDSEIRFETTAMGGWDDVTIITVKRNTIQSKKACKNKYFFKSGINIGMTLKKTMELGIPFKKEGDSLVYENVEELIVNNARNKKKGEIISVTDYFGIYVSLCEEVVCEIKFVRFQQDPIVKE